MTTDLKQTFAAFRQQAALGFRNKQDRDGEQLAIIALLNVCTALTEEVEALAGEVAVLTAASEALADEVGGRKFEKAAAAERMAKARAAKGKTA